MLKSIAMLLLMPACAYAADAVVGDTTVATWKYNRKGAFTMSFDDSLETHVKVAMPALVVRGLVGTWFINPGLARYKQNRSIWESNGTRNGQELANHTWDNKGAATYKEADFQIGKCARYIWSLRGPGASKLLAFAEGGGSTWKISEYEQEKLRQKYHCILRSSELSARTDQGVTSEMLIAKAQESISDRRWVAIQFHGTGGDWLSIDKTAFFRFLDHLSDHKDEIWSAGWIEAYQYIQEREHARIGLLEASEHRIRIDVKTGLDRELYVEPLTLITRVPDSWTAVKVGQMGKSKVYQARDGILHYEAVPDRGTIELAADREP